MWTYGLSASARLSSWSTSRERRWRPSPALSSGPRYGVSGAPVSTSPKRVERTTAGHVATSRPSASQTSACRQPPGPAVASSHHERQKIVPCGEAATNSSYGACELTRAPRIRRAPPRARGDTGLSPSPGTKLAGTSPRSPELASRARPRTRRCARAPRAGRRRGPRRRGGARGPEPIDSSTRATSASSARTCSTACSWVGSCSRRSISGGSTLHQPSYEPATPIRASRIERALSVRSRWIAMKSASGRAAAIASMRAVLTRFL